MLEGSSIPLRHVAVRSTMPPSHLELGPNLAACGGDGVAEIRDEQ
ncbi:hypothetical protein ACFQY5_33135 [Paeniroseomonas aquatica]